MSTNADGSINTQYMSLPNPVPGVTPGTAYATDIYNSLTIIDGHNHTAGSGQQIPTAGLNINADLPMNDYNITTIRSARFFVQATPITDVAPDEGCLFVSTVSGNNELFYNGTTGAPLQITSDGSLNVTSSGIANPPASASLISGTLVVKSTSTLAGDVDCGSVLFRDTSPNSTYAVTLSPISSLSYDYTLTLPTLPALTNVMTLNVLGQMSSITYDQVGEGMTVVGADAIATSMDTTGTNAIISTMSTAGANQIAANMSSSGANSIQETTTRSTGTSVGLLGVAISSNISFATTSTSYASVTSITIQTSGRPVYLQLVGNSSGSSITAVASTGGRIQIQRGSTNIGTFIIAQTGGIPVGGVAVIDTPSAGTYTYTLYAQTENAANSFIIGGSNLLAYEL